MGRSFGDSASFGKRMEYHAMNNFEKFNKIKNPMIYRRRGKESLTLSCRQFAARVYGCQNCGFLLLRTYTMERWL